MPCLAVGAAWGDSRGGRSPVFGVITEGSVTGLQGQAAGGRPRRALCANSLGFTLACCVAGRDAVRYAGCGEQHHGEGGGSRGREGGQGPCSGEELGEA